MNKQWLWWAKKWGGGGMGRGEGGGCAGGGRKTPQAICASSSHGAVTQLNFKMICKGLQSYLLSAGRIARVGRIILLPGCQGGCRGGCRGG